MSSSPPPSFEAMQPRKCLLFPNTGPPYSPNSLSRCHLTILPLLAFQSIWIPTILEWGFRRIDQQLNNGTRPYSRNMESQAQIMIAFFYLYGIRWCPGSLSGTKHAQGKIGLIKAGSLLSFHDLHECILTASALDFVLITTLFARFCIPQTTSLFTYPCRPFTSPFPQCQDLLHTPPTYVMTFWLVFFLLLVIPVALDWFESGMPISFHLTQWRPFSPDTSTLGLFPFLLRCYLFLLCLNIAFGDLDPGPPDPDSAIKPAFFWPATPLVDWVFSISVATILAICTIILRRGILKLRALSFLRLFQDHPKNLPNSYGVSLPSLRKADATTSDARSWPRAHPEKIPKSNEPKTYKHKRSPLTPHTFQSPFSRPDTSELPPLSPDAQGPVDKLYKPTNPVDLADIPATQMEIFGAGNVDGAGLAVLDSAGSVRDLSLQPRSITPTPKGGVYFDSDDEDRFPCPRPISRLGFNAEEVSLRWNSSRVLDGDSETEGTASMVFRTSLQQGEIPQPLIYRASLDPSLTLPCDATPPSPCRTPSNHSSGSPSPPTPEISSTSEDDCEDWDAFPLSPARVSYDWAHAASCFNNGVERGHEAEEFEKQRVFHLAQIPDLQTIEETSDEEMEMDLDS